MDMLWCQGAQKIGLSYRKLKSTQKCTVWSQCTPIPDRRVQRALETNTDTENTCTIKVIIFKSWEECNSSVLFHTNLRIQRSKSSSILNKRSWDMHYLGTLSYSMFLQYNTFVKTSLFSLLGSVHLYNMFQKNWPLFISTTACPSGLAQCALDLSRLWCGVRSTNVWILLHPHNMVQDY